MMLTLFYRHSINKLKGIETGDAAEIHEKRGISAMRLTNGDASLEKE